MNLKLKWECTKDQCSGFKNDKVMQIGKGEECEVVDKFCYLGDMLSVGGGADAAVVTRIGCAWKKFRELKPILTSKYVSCKTKGKIYTCLLYTSPSPRDATLSRMPSSA